MLQLSSYQLEQDPVLENLPNFDLDDYFGLVDQSSEDKQQFQLFLPPQPRQQQPCQQAAEDPEAYFLDYQWLSQEDSIGQFDPSIATSADACAAPASSSFSSSSSSSSSSSVSPTLDDKGVHERCSPGNSLHFFEQYTVLDNQEKPPPPPLSSPPSSAKGDISVANVDPEMISHDNKIKLEMDELDCNTLLQQMTASNGSSSCSVGCDSHSNEVAKTDDCLLQDLNKENTVETDVNRLVMCPPFYSPDGGPSNGFDESLSDFASFTSLLSSTFSQTQNGCPNDSKHHRPVLEKNDNTACLLGDGQGYDHSNSGCCLKGYPQSGPETKQRQTQPQVGQQLPTSNPPCGGEYDYDHQPPSCINHQYMSMSSPAAAAAPTPAPAPNDSREHSQCNNDNFNAPPRAAAAPASYSSLSPIDSFSYSQLLSSKRTKFKSKYDGKIGIKVGRRTHRVNKLQLQLLKTMLQVDLPCEKVLPPKSERLIKEPFDIPHDLAQTAEGIRVLSQYGLPFESIKDRNENFKVPGPESYIQDGVSYLGAEPTETHYDPVFIRRLPTDNDNHGWCDVCGEWFQLRNHSYAHHFKSKHGVSQRTKTLVRLPRVIRGGSNGDMNKVQGYCESCECWFDLHHRRGKENNHWQSWYIHQFQFHHKDAKPNETQRPYLAAESPLAHLFDGYLS